MTRSKIAASATLRISSDKRGPVQTQVAVVSDNSCIGDMAMPRAFFSTNLGQHPPRPLEEPLPSTIVRSNQELDKHVFGMALRERWPLVCKLINYSFDVSDYFDDLDIHIQGRGFLWTVLKQLAYENTVRRERITMFAMDWSRANTDRFEALGQETEIMGFFTDEEMKGVGEDWLVDVFARLKDLKAENRGRRGTGAWTQNTQRRHYTAPHPARCAAVGHKPPPKPNLNAHVTAPQQFQAGCVSSPVYTPSMVSSGSWNGYQPSMGQAQDGFQWASVHGSPQLLAYRPLDSHFSQFSPTGGVWDVRGPLPSPRFPPDLSQNAFGDLLNNRGSVAARRSRAPLRLKLDIGDGRLDIVQSQTPTPPTPFTAASLAQSGYNHEVGPSMIFEGAGGSMHNSQLHLHSMAAQTYSIGGNPWPVNAHPISQVENKQPVFPQSNRPNPVVNIRDPSYVPGDVRLLEPGPALRDSYHNNHVVRGKFDANHAFVESGLKDRNPNELRLGQSKKVGKEKKWRQ